MTPITEETIVVHNTQRAKNPIHRLALGVVKEAWCVGMELAATAGDRVNHRHTRETKARHRPPLARVLVKERVCPMEEEEEGEEEGEPTDDDDNDVYSTTPPVVPSDRLADDRRDRDFRRRRFRSADGVELVADDDASPTFRLRNILRAVRLVVRLVDAACWEEILPP